MERRTNINSLPEEKGQPVPEQRRDNTMVKVLDENTGNSVKIRVVGVGNAGCSIISRIFDQIQGVDFYAINTDGGGLKFSRAHVKLHIGKKTTGGGGTGRDPEKGKFAANEDRAALEEVLKGSGIVFLTAGLGGGTGTGSSPVIARIAKDLQAIVIALVTTPFAFEGPRKMEQAKTGLEVLEKNVDTLIHISNERLAEIVEQSTAMSAALGKVDEIISRIISSIADLINKPHPTLLDIDFADICAMVRDAGRGIVGLGYGQGENRIEKAARSAIEDPLLEKSEIMEAKKILISFTGSDDLTLYEVHEAMNIIQTRMSADAREVGVTLDPRLKNEVKVTLLATGLGKPYIEPKRTITSESLEAPLLTDDDQNVIDLPPRLREQLQSQKGQPPK